MNSPHTPTQAGARSGQAFGLASHMRAAGAAGGADSGGNEIHLAQANHDTAQLQRMRSAPASAAAAYMSRPARPQLVSPTIISPPTSASIRSGGTGVAAVSSARMSMHRTRTLGGLAPQHTPLTVQEVASPSAVAGIATRVTRARPSAVRDSHSQAIADARAGAASRQMVAAHPLGDAVIAARQALHRGAATSSSRASVASPSRTRARRTRAAAAAAAASGADDDIVNVSSDTDDDEATVAGVPNIGAELTLQELRQLCDMGELSSLYDWYTPGQPSVLAQPLDDAAWFEFAGSPVMCQGQQWWAPRAAISLRDSGLELNTLRSDGSRHLLDVPVDCIKAVRVLATPCPPTEVAANRVMCQGREFPFRGGQGKSIGQAFHATFCKTCSTVPARPPKRAGAAKSMAPAADAAPSRCTQSPQQLLPLLCKPYSQSLNEDTAMSPIEVREPGIFAVAFDISVRSASGNAGGSPSSEPDSVGTASVVCFTSGHAVNQLWAMLQVFANCRPQHFGFRAGSRPATQALRYLDCEHSAGAAQSTLTFTWPCRLEHMTAPVLDRLQNEQLNAVQSHNADSPDQPGWTARASELWGCVSQSLGKPQRQVIDKCMKAIREELQPQRRAVPSLVAACQRPRRAASRQAEMRCRSHLHDDDQPSDCEGDGELFGCTPEQSSALREARALSDGQELFNFPVLDMEPGSTCKSLRIFGKDVKSLVPHQLLNDNIVELLLEWFVHFESGDRMHEDVHIMSSLFFKRLRDNPADVRTWCRRVDVFRYKFILIPIVLHGHWSLAVICNPGTFARNLERELCNESQAGPSQVESDATADYMRRLQQLASQRERERQRRQALAEEQAAPSTVDSGFVAQASAHAGVGFEAMLASSRVLCGELDDIPVPPPAEVPGLASSADAGSFMASPDRASLGAADAQPADVLLPPYLQKGGLGIRCDMPLPYIVHMDSLGRSSSHKNSLIAKNLKRWLVEEWQQHLAPERGSALAGRVCSRQFPYSQLNLPVIRPLACRQTNGVDCGVFVVRYAQSFLQGVSNSFFTPWEAELEQLEKVFALCFQGSFDNKNNKMVNGLRLAGLTLALALGKWQAECERGTTERTQLSLQRYLHSQGVTSLGAGVQPPFLRQSQERGLLQPPAPLVVSSEPDSVHTPPTEVHSTSPARHSVHSAAESSQTEGGASYAQRASRSSSPSRLSLPMDDGCATPTEHARSTSNCTDEHAGGGVSGSQCSPAAHTASPAAAAVGHKRSRPLRSPAHQIACNAQAGQVGCPTIVSACSSRQQSRAVAAAPVQASVVAMSESQLSNLSPSARSTSHASVASLNDDAGSTGAVSKASWQSANVVRVVDNSSVEPDSSDFEEAEQAAAQELGAQASYV